MAERQSSGTHERRILDAKGPEVERLEEELERFRTATEDALQQLDWCIGYFVGVNKPGIAKSLGANRAYIRRHLLKRPEQAVPEEQT